MTATKVIGVGRTIYLLGARGGATLGATYDTIVGRDNFE